MANQLAGKTIAILATDGFEQLELTEPQKALKAAGATVHIISPSEGPAKTQKPGEIKGWNKTDWGETVKVDKDLKDVKAQDYDGLVLPGGVMNPDKLRQCKVAVGFVKELFRKQQACRRHLSRPMDPDRGRRSQSRTLTSWPSLKTDLTNAGATWVDKEVSVDNGLVTSRKPDDLPAFNARLIEEFGEGKYLQKAS